MTDEQHLELRDRLARLESQHSQIYEKLDKLLSEQDHFQEKVTESLLGNGRPGLITRVDRLEQRSANSSRLAWLVIAGVVTTITESALLFIKH
jgi:uncharacterized protein (DUF3084 family)